MKSENLQYLETMKGLGIFMVAFWAVALLGFAQEDNTPATKADTVKVQSVVSDNQDDERIYEMVEVNARFPGGENECHKWLSQHLRYPDKCQKKGIEGRVIVSFVVNRDGSICDVKAVRSPHPALAKESVRVVKAMPKWEPAYQGNKRVRSRFNLPLMFILNKPRQ